LSGTSSGKAVDIRREGVLQNVGYWLLDIMIVRQLYIMLVRQV